MYFCGKLRFSRLFFGEFGKKSRAVVVPIRFVSKSHQGHEIDPVAVFQRGQISIARANPNCVGYTEFRTVGSPHPRDIVIAPLNIDRVIVFERVHDRYRARSSVVNIPDNVQPIYGKPLGKPAKGGDDSFCASGSDDRLNDLVVIRFFVGDFRFLREKFLDDIAEFVGESVFERVARILGSDAACDSNQTQQFRPTPFVEIAFPALFDLQFFFRIINERRQFPLFVFAQRFSELVVYLFADRTRAVF